LQPNFRKWELFLFFNFENYLAKSGNGETEGKKHNKITRNSFA